MIQPGLASYTAKTQIPSWRVATTVLGILDGFEIHHVLIPLETRLIASVVTDAAA